MKLGQLGRVLVIGSVNVDLYQRTQNGAVVFGESSLDLAPVKGMTLPADSFVAQQDVACADAESFVLSMDGPFEQKTGGKGANAAAAAGQTCACEFLGNFGGASAAENEVIFTDLAAKNVATPRATTLPDVPTGTAYILLFDDNDNAIVLIGGANQEWPEAAALAAPGGKLHAAVTECACVMLQREVPPHVNVAAAKLARDLGKPVFLDLGGTDAPLDPALLPYISVIAPNESELTFVTGVPTSRADGGVAPELVREAVAALKAQFAAAGNGDVEVLVTLGSEGSMHFGSAWSGGADAAHETRMGRFELATADGRPRDTTGAGDCYRGSFVAKRYGEGATVEEAMRWAAAAAACSVEAEGALTSMPGREDIEARAATSLIEIS